MKFPGFIQNFIMNLIDLTNLPDKSIAEVQYANSRKQKAIKRALASRAEIEQKLYDDAVQRVLAEHKDWDLSKEA